MGARSDSEIYEELKARVARIGNDPKIQPLKDVIVQMGRLYQSVEAAVEPSRENSAPELLKTAFREQLNLDADEISNITEQQGQELLMKYWSSQRGHTCHRITDTKIRISRSVSLKKATLALSDRC